MGRFRSVLQSSFDVLKQTAVEAGANAFRRQLEAARSKLSDADPAGALEIAEALTRLGDVVGESGSIAPLVGAAHGVAGRARRALGDPVGSRESAARAVAVLQDADERGLKLDGAELGEWGLALAELDEDHAIEVLSRAVAAGGATPETYIQLGVAHVERGELEEAEGFLRDAIVILPDDPAANFRLGEILAATGRPADASHHLSVAGFEYLDRDELAEARPVLERAAELAPDDPAPAFGLAAVHRMFGDLETALAMAEQSRRLGPTIPSAHFAVGWVLFELGRHTEAQSAFDEGLALDPADSFGLAGAAHVLWATERADQAVAMARRAVDAGTDDGLITALAARSFENEDDEDEAIRLYTRALEIEPDLDWPRKRLVGLLIDETDQLLRRKKMDEAVAVAERAVEADSTSAAAHANLAAALSSSEQWAEALVAADAGLVLDESSTWAHLERAVALRGLDRLEAAIDAAMRATETDDTNARVWVLVGDLHCEQSDSVAAATAYRTAVEYDPDDRDALIKLSEALDLLSRDEEAVRPLSEFAQRHPDDAEVLRHLGIRLFWSNRDAESLDVLTRALKLDPDQPDARLHVGLVHVALAHWPEAVAWLQPLVDTEAVAASGYARASLAFALMALERHGDAAPLTRSVVVEQPEFAFGWQIRARLLNESGWFSEAVDAAARAVQLEPQTSWPYHSLAWAIERSADPLDAVAAWRNAEQVDPNDLWALKGSANVLDRTGQRELARDKYRLVLAALDDRAERAALDSDELALTGWCRLCLGDYADAVRLLISSVVVREEPSVQFDMSLAMLCGGQTRQALLEYERGIEWLEERCAPLRRRGLLIVALGDLDRFRSRLEGRALEISETCSTRLQTALAEYQSLHPDSSTAAGHDVDAADPIA